MIKPVTLRLAVAEAEMLLAILRGELIGDEERAALVKAIRAAVTFATASRAARVRRERLM